MITIDLLKNKKEAIPELVKIRYDVLGKIWLPDVTHKEVEDSLREHLNHDQLPLTVVAFHEGKPVGMGSLRKNDGIRPDLTPWLGTLVVSSSHQHQGIGQRIIDEIKVKTVQLGYKKLYLFAFDPTIPDYYERLGWQKIGMDLCNNLPVTVMEITLN